jgi:ABC-type multidrug transport system ATPase subunit
MNAIIVKNLIKNYGTQKILKTVNLKIEKGDFFSLMGPNGSGKSTLVSIITGTTSITKGAVSIYGHNLFEDPNDVKSIIGYVPQESFSCPRLTGRENLLYFAQLSGQDKITAKKWATDILEKMGLTEDADKLVSKYSGGMRKRLEVATALLPGVKILILDEPTTGFDPAARKMLLGSLLEINREGITIFLVTHIGEDAGVAKRVAFMKNGQIIVQDDPKTLKIRFKERTTVDVKLAMKDARIHSKLVSFNNGRKVLETAEGYKVYCDCPEEIITQIMSYLTDIGSPEAKVELNPVSLEDIFFFLTQQEVRQDLDDLEVKI